MHTPPGAPWLPVSLTQRTRVRWENARNGAGGDGVPVPAAGGVVSDRLSRRGAPVGSVHRRGHARPVHLLLRGQHRRVPDHPPDRARAHRADDHRHGPSQPRRAAPDPRLDRRPARPRGQQPGLERRHRPAAVPGQEGPAAARARLGDPDLRRRHRHPRPRLADDLPAARRRARRPRLFGDAPLPRRRGGDAGGAGRHQPADLAAHVARRAGAAASLAAAGRPAADQPGHRPGGRRAHLGRGRRRQPRRRRPDRAPGLDHDLARAHGAALEVDPAPDRRPRERGRQAQRGPLRRLGPGDHRRRARRPGGELQRDGRGAARARADPRGLRHLPGPGGRRVHPQRGLRRGGSGGRGHRPLHRRPGLHPVRGRQDAGRGRRRAQPAVRGHRPDHRRATAATSTSSRATACWRSSGRPRRSPTTPIARCARPAGSARR